MHVIQGRDDKLSTLKSLLEHLELDLAQTAYMGDDLPDLSALLAVNAGFTVPGADPWVAERIKRQFVPVEPVRFVKSAIKSWMHKASSLRSYSSTESPE